MKRITSLLMAAVMTMSVTVNVFATDVITFDENGNGTVVTETPIPTEAPAETSAEPVAEPTPAPESTIVLTQQKAYLSLGADLTDAQRATVLSLMGVKPENLANYDVVYVTNAEERERLGSYIDLSVIGTKSLSSVLIRPAEEGTGVVVNTQNISYCTPSMYQNALITAGVKNANVFVAGPSPISGTAALIGAIKAYEQMSGAKVSDNAIDTALNELVTTGELSDSVGNSDAERIISYVKAQVAANDLNTEAEIEAAIRQGMKDLDVSLTEEEIAKIVELMMKIKEMGIDFNVLADQAEEIYAKYKSQIDAGTFNIDDVKLEDLGLGKLVSSAVGGFFKSVTDSVKEFFTGFFSKKK